MSTSAPAPDSAPLRSALAEPTIMPTKWWVAGLTLANLGIMSGFFGPIQVLLAQQAAVLAPDGKELALVMVQISGAAVSCICNPLWGAFSDRTRSRFGRRVPWLAAGMVGGVASLLLLSIASSLTMMIVAWCGVQATLNMMFAAVTAAVPDQVPVERRGLVGGVLNIAQTLGVVCGVGIANATGSIAAGYVATACFLAVVSLPYLLNSKDLALPADHRVPPFRIKEFLIGFWVSPREHPDFAWAWATRFLIQFSNSLGTGYLLYYVTDGLRTPPEAAESRVGILVAVYAASGLLTAATFGQWSDRLGVRKPFVIGAGLTCALASLILGLTQSWPGAVAGAVVLGLGFGVYSAVDFALITQVLPSAAGRAKDLGVINIAAALPQVLAPPLAALIVLEVRHSSLGVAGQLISWSTEYAVLYLVSAFVGVLGSIGVTRIRSVR